MPQPITGTILLLFPSICTGNDTYFSASYWHVVATTLDKATRKYFQTGQLLRRSSRLYSAMVTAYEQANKRLENEEDGVGEVLRAVLHGHDPLLLDAVDREHE